MHNGICLSIIPLDDALLFMRFKSDKIELREHKSARWLRSEELGSVEWLPADKEVIENIKVYYKLIIL